MDRRESPAAYQSKGSKSASTTPSSFATFDVNTFLKKTFSDFDIGDCSNESKNAPTSLSVPDQQRPHRPLDLRFKDSNPSAEMKDQPKHWHHQKGRRTGSIPSTSNDQIIGLADSKNPSAAEWDLDDGDYQSANHRAAGSSRRSRSRSRCEGKSSAVHICAYCGEHFNRRSTTSSNTRNLYCSTCTSFFTRHSPSELQRRIAYEEMTRPSLHSQPVSSNSDASRPCDNKETAPLLCESSTTNKVVLVNNTGNTDGENENGENLPEENDGHVEAEEMPSHRYARNDRLLHGRRHFQTKAKQPVQTMPYRHQQPDDYHATTKTDSLFGHPATIVVWNQENPANSRRSSFTSASSLNRPTCRICHLYGEPGDTLVSPCRCAGTMQYIHTSCLVHWLEISTKKVLPSPHCELCGYHYRTHHCYRLKRMHTPSCNRRDRVLHFVFMVMVFIMIGCSALSAVYLRQDKGSGYKRVALNSDDIIVIASALLFFCAFFVAVFTQYRAETSICRLCLRFWLINRHWRVKDYDKNLDYERQSKLGHSSLIMEQI